MRWNQHGTDTRLLFDLASMFNKKRIHEKEMIQLENDPMAWWQAMR